MDHPIAAGYLYLIVLFPLLGAGLNGLAGATIQRHLGKGAISFIACAPVCISFLLSLWAFAELLTLEPERRFLIDRLYTWISLGSLKVDVASRRLQRWSEGCCTDFDRT